MYSDISWADFFSASKNHSSWIIWNQIHLLYPQHFLPSRMILKLFQGEGVLPMDTSETPSTENTNQTQGTSTEAASQTSSLARYT